MCNSGENSTVRNWIPSFSWLLFAAWQRNRASTLQIFEDAKKMEKRSQPWSNDTITPWALFNVPYLHFLSKNSNWKMEGCASIPRLYFYHFPCTIVEIYKFISFLFFHLLFNSGRLESIKKSFESLHRKFSHFRFLAKNSKFKYCYIFLAKKPWI